MIAKFRVIQEDGKGEPMVALLCEECALELAVSEYATKVELYLGSEDCQACQEYQKLEQKARM